MKEWRKVLIKPKTSVLKTIEIIDASSIGIAIVVGNQNRLLGTVTDGDIRRAILRGYPLSEPVEKIMNLKPTVVQSYTTRDEILSLMKTRQLKQIPIVDQVGCVVSVELWDTIMETSVKENWVVLMAGGLGKRLEPLTNDCPKPLLRIGDKPILETIIQNFSEHGFKKIFISVNYKAEMIEDYFGDGSKWGVQISYIYEKERLGTAGALNLLPETPKTSVLVMNGDLLTKVNFNYLLNFHNEHKAQATMCVREYQIQVPYGVVKIDRHRLKGIIEKPVQQFFVNAGVYVLEPEVLKMIQNNTYIDMPNVFEKIVADGRETAVFPVREYWLDIGRMVDFERAKGEFAEVFR